jgi:hypothetical protein
LAATVRSLLTRSHRPKVLSGARNDALYLEPAKSATVNNAGVDQAGRDDVGEA